MTEKAMKLDHSNAIRWFQKKANYPLSKILMLSFFFIGLWVPKIECKEQVYVAKFHHSNNP